MSDGKGSRSSKVDNQLVVERMAAGNFPIWDGGRPLSRGAERLCGAVGSTSDDQLHGHDA